jgi:hypothetical protein
MLQNNVHVKQVENGDSEIFQTLCNPGIITFSHFLNWQCFKSELSKTATDKTPFFSRHPDTQH